LTTLVCHHLSIVKFHHFTTFVVTPKMKSPLCHFCWKWNAWHLQKWISQCKRFWIWNGIHLCQLYHLLVSRCYISFCFFNVTYLFLVVCIVLLLFHCALEVYVVYFLVMCAIMLLLCYASKIFILCFWLCV
jgi:hypothetical protein